jgi:hypothetical protein
MFELGKRSEIFSAELLEPLSIYGRPSQMPSLPQGHDVICGYDQGLGERMIVCESLEDMQQLYDSYARGYALRIYWYSGEDVGCVYVLGAGDT